MQEIVDKINTLEGDLQGLSDGSLCAKTGQFKRRLENGETLDDILVEAFATDKSVDNYTAIQNSFSTFNTFFK